MANVRLENLTRKYQNRHQNIVAVEDISLEIPDGQFWVLVGPSGCGKSTIMRTIAGLDSPTSGNVYIDHQLVNDIPARQRDVAMVFQNYALYPHFTVAENLGFGLKMQGISPTIIQEKITKVAQSLGIEHLLNRQPKQLSGGQQQRVALGRAIVRQPRVFLLDEPLSNLDAQLRDDMRAELKELHQKIGITTIYVTHDQIEAMTLADKIVVLNQGKIQQIGDPYTLYNRPINQMVGTFLGNPPLNILSTTYQENQFHFGSQSLPCPPTIREKLKPREGQGFNLGIRSEHLEIAQNQPPLQKELDQDLWALEKGLIQIQVKVVEPLGRETLIRGILPQESHPIFTNNLIQLQVSPTHRITSGDTLSVLLDFNHLLIFDPSTQDRLYP